MHGSFLRHCVTQCVQVQPPTSIWRLSRKHFIPIEFLELDRAEELGEGAFGRVFKGKLHRQPVAIKTCVLPSLKASTQIIRMFRREAHVRVCHVQRP